MNANPTVVKVAPTPRGMTYLALNFLHKMFIRGKLRQLKEDARALIPVSEGVEEVKNNESVGGTLVRIVAPETVRICKL